jgi:hypothetical protein
MKNGLAEFMLEAMKVCGEEEEVGEKMKAEG